MFKQPSKVSYESQENTRDEVLFKESYTLKWIPPKTFSRERSEIFRKNISKNISG